MCSFAEFLAQLDRCEKVGKFYKKPQRSYFEYAFKKM